MHRSQLKQTPTREKPQVFITSNKKKTLEGGDKLVVRGRRPIHCAKEFCSRCKGCGSAKGYGGGLNMEGDPDNRYGAKGDLKHL